MFSRSIDERRPGDPPRTSLAPSLVRPSGAAPVVSARGDEVASGGAAVGPSGRAGVSAMAGSEPVEREYINPDSLAQMNGASHAVRHGRVLYIGGQLPLDRRGEVVGSGDRRAQMSAAFQNLLNLLAQARSSSADVLRVTVYLVGYTPADRKLMREVASDFFPARKAPAVTILGVESVGQEGALVAVDAIALMTVILVPVEARRPERGRGSREVEY
jgi:2-iminobutanoate/2-iminopropanoate deaminase